MSVSSRSRSVPTLPRSPVTVSYTHLNRKLNVTIVIFTHEIAVVKAICNKVAVSDTAEFVEWGDTAEIFKNPRSDMTRLLLGYEVMKK